MRINDKIIGLVAQLIGLVIRLAVLCAALALVALLWLAAMLARRVQQLPTSNRTVMDFVRTADGRWAHPA